ncbi:uncharacterized protein TEOVI_000048300 [Trypanosoma equiperdum]|uniref:Trypanosome variant surface glycoprotein A-type N-terminal domain-containing protein n=1 Tax=Trypanosoma equiperdum TaxID=5694 RepID=A0A1G4I7F6_TRYEQ|nr:hypothetical protein TEOVI_000048300 [Trypanosoma equiperdum]
MDKRAWLIAFLCVEVREAHSFLPNQKQMTSACHVKTQLEAIALALAEVVKTQQAEIRSARIIEAKLSLAAATSKGDQELAFAAIGSSTAAKIATAQSALDRATNQIQDGVAAAEQLAGAADVVADIEKLTIKVMPDTTLAGTAIDTDGKMHIRFTAVGAAKSTCDDPDNAVPPASAHPSPDTGNNIIEFRHLSSRSTTGSDEKIAVLCGNSGATNDCAAVADTAVTNIQLTQGNPFSASQTKFKTDKATNTAYKAEKAKPNDNIPSQDFVKIRLAKILEAAKKYKTLTFKAATIESSTTATSKETRETLLVATQPGARRSQLAEHQQKLDQLTTKLFGESGSDVKKKIWTQLDALPIQQEAALDGNLTTLGKLDTLVKIHTATAFYLARRASEITTAAQAKKEPE